ncbi:uncharacterized protein BCR38DRAFT_484010 [Pseudomassariella vexata]|uniref:Pt repeat family protein n=1 Tax=Pseudomassariella vexata TaxID=1141098 RepID=A0A1Y2E4L0_9PEZI|nr:uncharacterized protein BCR38DRAFT_484010 [Pseudomassariella vexata]ORY66377.1 hypothetical protein BCR38DRAFT_484010 [Pseudomassariella vexata]
MAWDASKSKPAIFHNRIKSFVRDVRGLRRDSRGHERNVQSSDTETPRAPAGKASQIELEPEETPRTPATQESQTKAAESRPTPPTGKESRTDPPPGPGLSVHLTLTFEDPLDFSYNRTYNSSPNLRVSEKLCRGLLRHVDHTCTELITRKDPIASTPTRLDGIAKPKQFDMTFQILKGGSEWATRTHSSYQKQSLTTEVAKEIVLASHRIVGLFLKRHDPDFIWKDGAIRDESLEDPETTPYRIGSVQSLHCVPRSHFLEASQTFEMIPGFTIDLLLTSRSKRRKPPEWQKTIQIRSFQTTPLNLEVAETLFSDSSYSLEGALRARRRTVQDQHRQCRLIGGSCQHYEDDAVEIVLRVTNNLGPQFNHLERTVRTKVALLGQPEAQDCIDFYDTLEKSLNYARDVADSTIRQMDDLDFQIVELRGRGWELDEPLVCTLGLDVSHSRRSIEAILDRVQTGVGDTLRGNALHVRMSALKRGHCILDKTLVAREPASHRWNSPSKQRTKVVDRLKQRVDQDIQMVCKDTCKLDAASLKSASEYEEYDRPQPADIPLPESPLPVVVEELPESVMIPDVTSPVEPFNVETAREYVKDATAPVSETSEVSERPQSPTFIRCPRSGARVFPLMPSPSSFGLLEFFDSDALADSEGDQATVDAKSADELQMNDEVVPGKDCDAQVHPFDPQSSGEQPDVVPNETEKPTNHSTDGESSSHDNQINEVKGTLPQGMPQVDEFEARPRSNADARDDISVAPSTPCLTFGSGHSPRSSLMFTPKIHGSITSTDIEIVMADSSRDNLTEYNKPYQPQEIGADQKTLKISPDGSPSLTPVRPRLSSSPLKQHLIASGRDSFSLADPVQDSSSDAVVNPAEPGIPTPLKAISSLDEVEAEEPDLPPTIGSQDSKDETKPTDEQTTEGSGERVLAPERSRRQLVIPSTAAVPTKEVEPKTPLEDELPSPSGGFPSADGGFAQTRPEFDLFDFSSPFASSPLSDQQEQSQHGFISDQIPEGEERERGDRGGSSISSSNSSGPLSRRGPTVEDVFVTRRDSLEDINFVRPQLTTKARQKSFGSAGLIGFHAEHRLIDVGLRRVLMPARHSFYGAGGGFLASPRPASSHGMGGERGLGLRGGGRGREMILRRPASSGGWVDLPLSVGMSRSLQRSWEWGGEDGEQRQHRHLTVMRRSTSSNMVPTKREVEVEAERRRAGPGLMALFVGGVTLASQMLRPS